MRQKGWNQREIEESIRKMSRRPARKNEPLYHYSRNIVFWTTILVLLISNLIVALVLVPVFILTTSAYVYILIAVFGLMLGMIFNHLISDIEHLRRGHHVFAAFFIPALAVVNILFILPAANALSSLLRFNAVQNPLSVASVYVLAFLLPYLWSNIGRKP